jgi:hypothetical protein
MRALHCYHDLRQSALVPNSTSEGRSERSLIFLRRRLLLFRRSFHLSSGKLNSN